MRRYVLQAFVALAIATSWILVMPEARVAQPVAFNHAKHGAVACTICHAGATAGARAGIPQGDVCLRCHATAPARGFPAAVWTDVEAGRRIAWRQITLVPDHVRFSHRRHTDAGHLACVSCHEDVQARTTPPDRAAVRLVMNTCLSCHKREGASEDCAGCHR